MQWNPAEFLDPMKSGRGSIGETDGMSDFNSGGTGFWRLAKIVLC